MWHLGLPTLFSNTLAYKRVAGEIGVAKFCIDSSNWKSILENLEVNSLNNSLNIAENYIDKTHTRDILVEKWQTVFETVLDKNAKI